MAPKRVRGTPQARHAPSSGASPETNTVPDLPFRRPAPERAAEIARLLHRRGVLTKLRQSAGHDIDGGCGQLRARAIDSGSRRIPIVAV